jgi:hypothetical protein
VSKTIVSGFVGDFTAAPDPTAGPITAVAQIAAATPEQISAVRFT